MAQAFNIYSGSLNWIEATLSNLAHTPFFLDEEYIASVEGFYQGIKYQDIERRRRVFELYRAKSKSAGQEANEVKSGFVYWKDQKLVWKSQEHNDLYYRALLEKYTQDETAKSALLSTGDALFSHEMPRGGGLDLEQFQSSFLCQSLYKIRQSLSGE